MRQRMYRSTRRLNPQCRVLTAMALIRISLLRIADRELGANASPTREALLRILQRNKDEIVARLRARAAPRLGPGGHCTAACVDRQRFIIGKIIRFAGPAMQPAFETLTLAELIALQSEVVATMNRRFQRMVGQGAQHRVNH